MFLWLDEFHLKVQKISLNKHCYMKNNMYFNKTTCLFYIIIIIKKKFNRIRIKPTFAFTQMRNNF